MSSSLIHKRSTHESLAREINELLDMCINQPLLRANGNPILDCWRRIRDGCQQVRQLSSSTVPLAAKKKGTHGWMNAVTDERLGRPFVRQSVSPRSDGRINGSLPFEISVPSDPRQPLNGHNGFLGSLASFIATSGLSKCHEFQIMNGENRPLVTDEPGWRSSLRENNPFF